MIDEHLRPIDSLGESTPFRQNEVDRFQIDVDVQIFDLLQLFAEQKLGSMLDVGVQRHCRLFDSNAIRSDEFRSSHRSIRLTLPNRDVDPVGNIRSVDSR